MGDPLGPGRFPSASFRHQGYPRVLCPSRTGPSGKSFGIVMADEVLIRPTIECTLRSHNSNGSREGAVTNESFPRCNLGSCKNWQVHQMVLFVGK